MSVHLVQFSTDPSDTTEVETAITELFRSVAAATPTGLRYRGFRLGESAEFMLFLELPDGALNPLLSIDDALSFRDRIAGWAGGPVPPVELVELGSYSA